MLTMAPYLYFRGACAEALAFYQSVGLGAVVELRRYGGARHGEAWNDKVLHACFEGPGVRFFASDGPDSEPMKGCALFLEIGDLGRATAIFDALSHGGTITVPFAVQFWGDRYGNFTDRFGVQWAVASVS